jgi:catalase
MGGLSEAPKPAKDYHQWVEGHLGRYQTTRTQDDYKQAGDRYRTFQDWERDDLLANLVADMKDCPEHIALRMVWHFWHADPDYGRRVAEGAGIDLEKAKSLPPLEGKPAPGQKLPASTYTDGRREGTDKRPEAAE